MLALPVLLALALLLAPAAAASDPGVARPALRIGDELEERGLAFFLRDAGGGTAAVTTAHGFDLSRLVEASRVEFRLSGSHQQVGAATRLLAPPGVAFNAPGGSLAGDFLLFALDAPLAGARVLEPDAAGELATGDEVRVIGAGEGERDQQEILGRVALVTASRIEVDLDEPHDLAGWGGAPVVSADTGRAVGLLQAFWTRGSGATLVASPIASITAALARPLENGRGRPLAAFADLAVLRGGGPEPGAEDAPLLRQAPQEPGLRLSIAYPPAGTRVPDTGCGAFVAGTASPRAAERPRFDIAFAIDTSSSTLDATGVDINGNGVVGRRLGSAGSLFSAEHTDPGDSILAAEVAAARQLLSELDPRGSRVAVVTFAGAHGGGGVAEGRLFRPGGRHAETVEPLTHDFERIQAALDGIVALTPVGLTHIEAGIYQATLELLGLRGARSRPDPKSQKVVFFFTDGQPTLPYGPSEPAQNVLASLEAADKAGRGGIRIHTFAIGPEALAGPIVTVEMAARTGGTFTPVRYPGDLVDAVEVVDFPELRDLRLHSATTGEPAQFFRMSANGTWEAFVRLAPGPNRLEIRARADDGTETRAELEIEGAVGAAAPPIPPRLAARRNQLLEDCLQELQTRRAQTERRRAEQLRQELRLQIERERERARQRAAEQRRELKLEVE